MEKVVGIFFDMKQLKKNKNRVKKFLSVLNPDAYTNLIFVVVPESIFNELDTIPPGSSRIEFVASTRFLENILYSLCTVYSIENKTIFLGDCKGDYILLFLDAVNLYFEDSFHVISEYDDSLVESGFSNPFVCFKNKICLVRPNKFIDPVDKAFVDRDIAYINSQKENTVCSTFITIEPETLEFLQFTTKASVKPSDDGRLQREVFGMLKIGSSRVENGDVIYELKIDKNSLQYGTTENVSNAEPYLYTFHSHPYQAYRRHNTIFGFPSATDYVAMYMLHKMGAIIHFVASLEGLYIIHVNLDSPLLSKSKKVVTNYIMKNYNIKKNSVKDLKSHIEKINQHGLFILDLIPWDTKNKKIKVFFNKTKDNCIIR